MKAITLAALFLGGVLLLRKNSPSTANKSQNKPQERKKIVPNVRLANGVEIPLVVNCIRLDMIKHVKFPFFRAQAVRSVIGPNRSHSRAFFLSKHGRAFLWHCSQDCGTSTVLMHTELKGTLARSLGVGWKKGEFQGMIYS